MKTTNSGTQNDYLKWKRSKMAAANRAFVRGDVKLCSKFQSKKQRDLITLRRVEQGNPKLGDLHEISLWSPEYKNELENIIKISNEESSNG